jgi:uncharacterized protein (DUF2236 family)
MANHGDARPGPSAVGTMTTMDANGDLADLLGYCGPGSVTWRVGREWVMLLGAGRAVLMQLAHPLVAAGVAQHSSFFTDPVGRSYRTVEFTQVMAFGTRAEAHAMARSVNRLHAGVVGTLGREVGAYSTLTPYRARDGELLLWVFATLVDSGLYLYPLLVGPLSREEQERYYQESKRTVVLLGLSPALLPATLCDFETYIREMLASPALSVMPEARALGRQLLYLPAPAPLRLVQPLGEQLTAGFLPSRLREEYRFTWDARRERLLEMGTAASRRLLPLVPPRLRYTHWSRRAAARVHALMAEDPLAAPDGVGP